MRVEGNSLSAPATIGITKTGRAVRLGPRCDYNTAVASNRTDDERAANLRERQRCLDELRRIAADRTAREVAERAKDGPLPVGDDAPPLPATPATATAGR
jgi:hypothetical protein